MSCLYLYVWLRNSLITSIMVYVHHHHHVWETVHMSGVTLLCCLALTVLHSFWKTWHGFSPLRQATLCLALKLNNLFQTCKNANEVEGKAFIFFRVLLFREVLFVLYCSFLKTLLSSSSSWLQYSVLLSCQQFYRIYCILYIFISCLVSFFSILTDSL